MGPKNSEGTRGGNLHLHKEMFLCVFVFVVRHLFCFLSFFNILIKRHKDDDT